MTALLSVIIPTHRRPQQLPRAISSALHAAPGGDVEVLVVPNGADDSWRLAAEKFRHDPRIKWSYLPQGNACAARNHGLSISKSKYVRFLDDDDHLYPAAARQLELLDHAGADIASAPLENIFSSGKPPTVAHLPPTQDFTSCALLPSGVSAAQGSLFLRSALGDCRWPEDALLYDDYIWILRVAENGERDWCQMEKPVGAYVHHFNTRLSYARRTARNSRQIVEAIIGLHNRLTAESRGTPERRHAVATALLTHAHSAFPVCPFYLSGVIQLARRLDQEAMPSHSAFRHHPWLARHLLMLEWAALAPRHLSRGLRRASWSIRGLFPAAE